MLCTASQMCQVVYARLQRIREEHTARDHLLSVLIGGPSLSSAAALDTAVDDSAFRSELTRTEQVAVALAAISGTHPVPAVEERCRAWFRGLDPCAPAPAQRYDQAALS